MEHLFTHERGLRFFLDVTGCAFEGRYPFKTSAVGETAIEIMRPQWVSEKPGQVVEFLPRTVN